MLTHNVWGARVLYAYWSLGAQVACFLILIPFHSHWFGDVSSCWLVNVPDGQALLLCASFLASNVGSLFAYKTISFPCLGYFWLIWCLCRESIITWLCCHVKKLVMFCDEGRFWILYSISSSSSFFVVRVNIMTKKNIYSISKLSGT